jgi:hypothetical protein
MVSPLNVTKLPAPRVALIDPATGLVSREWYRFFLNLFELTGSGSNPVSLDELQIGPPNNDQFVLDLQNITDAQTNDSPLLSDIAELQKQVQAAELSAESAVSALQAQIMQLTQDIQALAVAPPVTPQLKRARYGSFYDTTTQTATTINTAKAITFNTTDLSNGVYLGTPTSRVYVDTPGIYNFDTSFQLDKTAGGVGLFYFWFRLNGVDVPDSASQIRIQGNNAEIFSSLNFFFDLNAGDYVELMFSVDDLSVEILAEVASAPHPGIPSIILTVANNIEGASI